MSVYTKTVNSQTQTAEKTEALPTGRERKVKNGETREKCWKKHEQREREAEITQTKAER